MTTRRRTIAREIAIQALYQIEVHRNLERGVADGAEVELDPTKVDDIESNETRGFDVEEFITAESDDSEVRAFCRSLCNGAINGMERSDRLIADIADNWDFDRIAALDKAILRLAVYELTDSTEVPPKVVINEAIELAKKYSTAPSGSFINGILDRLMIRGEKEGGESGEDEALWNFRK